MIIEVFAVNKGLKEALPYLKRAEEDYERLEIYSSVLDVQYLQSITYHNLGLIDERDAAAERHGATEATKRRLEGMTMEEDVNTICELVADIGAALSARWVE